MSTEPMHQGRNQVELVSLDMLVPKDHLLRMIDEHIDFSFITEKTKPYYPKTQGRPPIPPIRLFKMMLIGYLYGIRSERQLENEINLNIAYRWFLGLGLSERVPDHSTISHNRNERFKDSPIFQELFDELVHLAIRHGMVGGRVLLTDSTHIRANANNNRYTMQTIDETPHAYLKELEEAVQQDRIQAGKKPLPPAKEASKEDQQKTSVTDPESGYMTRPGKPEGFHYLDHRTVDHKFNIITDVHITPGNVNDSVVYIDRLRRQIETFGFHDLEAVALDSGYMTPYICKQTLEANVFPAIVPRKATTRAGTLPKAHFTFNATNNTYVCPQGQELTYKLTNREGYRLYASDASHCATCPMLAQCTSDKSKQRKIQRHVWEEFREQVEKNASSPAGQLLLRWRQRKIEPSFGEAKELHGYRRCKYRGRAKTQEQALLTAFAQNVKKIARHLAQLARTGLFREKFRVAFFLRFSYARN
ncbi:IS1182 family transposase, partial [Paenibacillus sp. 598K]|uniref:IS1182 family transposase n=1 Tax=Paenibacillus sp. 598K TaxID=1117987 RepID=UPI0021AA06FF